MVIKNISIENFKSIDKLSLNIAKYGDSYTRMLVGINESGKSNILKAISFFNVPSGEYNYAEWQNQKDEDSKFIDLYFELSFKNKNAYIEKIREITKLDKIDIEIKKIIKNVYLAKDENCFNYRYDCEIDIQSKFYVQKTIQNQNIGGTLQATTIYNFSYEKKSDEYKEVTPDFFNKYFSQYLNDIIEQHEPKMSFWQPSETYLITSDINLNTFKDNTASNIPLKNVFAIAGYETNEKIKEKIDEISNSQKRSRLAATLSDETTKYIKNIWQHNIIFVIEISETGNCTISVKDGGKENEHDRHSMSARSEGFKQFISLILSLSIETKKFNKKNQLILIDEPENHLHPSGIRDMRDELLRIGKENYLFVSTHSPFLIDQKNKERNIVVKKNNKAQTIIKEIKEDDDIRGDEVLREAFGINIYKDLLNPQRILLEGASDKKILDKVFQIKSKDISTTNGHGSNIDTTASMFNSNNISIIVIVDDDKDGKLHKEKILKIGGVYSNNNVFTLKDLVSDIVDNGTIEDLLGKEFIESKFKQFYEDKYGEKCEIVLTDTPFVEQIKLYLLKVGKKIDDNLLDDFKAIISNDLSLPKTKLEYKFPLLEELYKNIEKKLKMKDID